MGLCQRRSRSMIALQVLQARSHQNRCAYSVVKGEPETVRKVQ